MPATQTILLVHPRPPEMTEITVTLLLTVAVLQCPLCPGADHLLPSVQLSKGEALSQLRAILLWRLQSQTLQSSASLLILIGVQISATSLLFTVVTAYKVPEDPESLSTEPQLRGEKT